MTTIAPEIDSNSLLKYYQGLWAPIYESVHELIGSTGTIITFADPNDGQPNATTFKTRGEEQFVFTLNEPLADWDIPLDLTSPDSFEGIVPIVSFNGTDEEADSPDDTYWSRGDGSNDFPFSIGAWLKVTNTGANKYFLSKWRNTATALTEWYIVVLADEKLRFVLQDLSEVATTFRTADAAMSVDVWVFVVATYDGAGGASAADTMTLYQDGVAIASTATNAAGYVAMENTAALMNLGMREVANDPYAGSMAGGPLSPFFTQVELSADAIAQLYNIGRKALGV